MDDSGTSCGRSRPPSGSLAARVRRPAFRTGATDRTSRFLTSSSPTWTPCTPTISDSTTCRTSSSSTGSRRTCGGTSAPIHASGIVLPAASMTSWRCLTRPRFTCAGGTTWSTRTCSPRFPSSTTSGPWSSRRGPMWSSPTTSSGAAGTSLTTAISWSTIWISRISSSWRRATSTLPPTRRSLGGRRGSATPRPSTPATGGRDSNTTALGTCPQVQSCSTWVPRKRECRVVEPAVRHSFESRCSGPSCQRAIAQSRSDNRFR